MVGGISEFMTAFFVVQKQLIFQYSQPALFSTIYSIVCQYPTAESDSVGGDINDSVYKSATTS